MFGKIALFELRYQFRNPVFWVVSILFFLLTFGAVTADNISIGGGGNIHANSPAAIAQTSIILTIFFMFVTTAFVANVIVRDDESGFGPLVRSTQVSKFDYLIGRFAGAFGIAAIAFITVPAAIWLGSLMPWIDSETLGPNRLSHYLHAYFLLALPGIFLTSAIFFAVATITRSMMYSYLGVVLFLVLYLIFSAVVQSRPDWLVFGAYVEPFGVGAYEYITRYWTAEESNNNMAPFTGILLANRLIWIGVALLALLFAYSRFSFAERAASTRQLRRQNKIATRLAKIQPVTAKVLPDAQTERTAWQSLYTRTIFEMTQVFKSPAFFVLIVIGLFNSSAALFFGNESYGTAPYPVTFAILPTLLGSFTIIPMIIAIFYGGELVWRDRDRKMHEIVDSTPLPNWIYMVSKTVAVFGVLLATILISVIAAITIQLAKGYFNIEFGKYLAWYVAPLTVSFLIIAVLSVFVQALSPNKYVGWGIMVLYLVATITFNALGYDHPLLLYGSGINVPLSDINGNAVGSTGDWWMQLYWGAFAVILAVIAHLLWRRGTETRLMPGLKQLPKRLISPSGVVLGAAALVAGGSGAYIFYNTNILNKYQTSDDIEALQAAFEKKYLKYETIKQPSLTQITLAVDIYPDETRMEASGSYSMINDTGAPVRELHVRFGDPETKKAKVDLPGATLKMKDDEFRYYIYRFDTPMQPGETRKLSFSSQRWQQGFRASGNDTRLVKNGTFLNNAEFSPTIGMDRNGLLSDRITRRKYDLPAELRPAKLEDKSARERNYLSDTDWVMSDITISTVADQTPIAPGERISDEVTDGRRTARFVSKSPILAFFSIQSADYSVKRSKADGVDLSVYHHAGHAFNVDTMLHAMEESLSYYKANFGPYQFDHARVIEFPGYASFAQAFAGTMPYSEAIGFIADLRDPENIDYVTYVTAHEMGHQYWAHQLVSADQQGGTILVETLAQYSALMVMKKLYGEDKIRRFLQYELDQYLSSRGGEVIEELPLNRVENQGYIHYRKGAVVMYVLQDRLGEDRVNAMLADLLDKYRFKSQPYASSTDLVDGFKSLARNEAEQKLVVDLLEKITVYDMKASEALVKKLGKDKFETTITVEAAKYHADGVGKETKSDLSDTIDIGLFSRRPGEGAFDSKDVLMMERRPIRDGKQVIRIVTAKKPAFAGVDPYNKYIDRNSDDNVIAVTDS